MPGCCEADCRALCFSQTLLTGSYSDPLVKWWEVSIFLRTVREKFPIRLISKEHSWQEGICGGRCFSLWQISPRVLLGQMLLNVLGACRESVLRKQPAREPQGSPFSPAPATPPADSLVRSNQNPRKTGPCHSNPLSQSLLETSGFLWQEENGQLIHFQRLKHLLCEGSEPVSNGQRSVGLDTPRFRSKFPSQTVSAHLHLQASSPHQPCQDDNFAPAPLFLIFSSFCC